MTGYGTLLPCSVGAFLGAVVRVTIGVSVGVGQHFFDLGLILVNLACYV